MASTNTRAVNGAKTMDFTPVDIDVTHMPPDAPAGTWTAVCKVTKGKTNTGGYPMLTLQWKLEATDNEEHETFLGASVFDRIVVFPEGHKASKMGKQRIRSLCALIKYDYEEFPKRVTSWDDLDSFIEALDGQRYEIHTRVGIRRDTGEEVTEVRYASPNQPTKTADDDESEEEEARPKAAKNLKGGKAARR